MIDCRNVGPGVFKLTNQLIVKEASRRGWQAHTYYVGSSHIFLERPDGHKIHLFSSVPPSTSFAASFAANDKHLCSLMMGSNGIPVPETYMSDDYEESIQLAQSIMRSGRAVVIKPLSEAHGNGVTVNVTDHDSLKRALRTAREYTKSLVVQEYIPNPVDIRVTIINGKYVAALVRIPARVFGDGEHSIRELITLENSKETRGHDYHKPLNKINIAKAEMYLGDTIESIPPSGQEVRVLGTANVGTGGETIDITDVLPEKLRQLACKAARLIGLSLCGVDFILRKVPQAGDSYEDLDPIFIEINKSPSLFIHETPTFGVARPVTATYFDYLSTL